MIVGGESGPGARPLKRSGSKHSQDPMRKSFLPFFFKQWGGVRKKVAGRKLNGRLTDELPEIERQAQPPRKEN